VSRAFEQLDWQETPMGVLCARRRLEPSLQIDVYEVLLGDEHLMSSLFTVAETALATLGLAAVDGDELDVVVGGLGLGYTALAALEDPRVRSLRVVEALEVVIGWHQQGLFPWTARLTSDPRCTLVHADFFAMVADATLDPAHAVLLDIDHTPTHVLHPSHAAFYEPAGLARLAERLNPGGAFALWSDTPAAPDFTARLEHAIGPTDVHRVPFPNPHTGCEAANTVYVSTRAVRR
jgi:spermidine synthase